VAEATIASESREAAIGPNYTNQHQQPLQTLIGHLSTLQQSAVVPYCFERDAFRNSACFYKRFGNWPGRGRFPLQPLCFTGMPSHGGQHLGRRHFGQWPLNLNPIQADGDGKALFDRCGPGHWPIV
jgi:hypothetical protein